MGSTELSFYEKITIGMRFLFRTRIARIHVEALVFVSTKKFALPDRFGIIQ